jgi:hypothetical protein
MEVGGAAKLSLTRESVGRKSFSRFGIVSGCEAGQSNGRSHLAVNDGIERLERIVSRLQTENLHLSFIFGFLNGTGDVKHGMSRFKLEFERICDEQIDILNKMSKHLEALEHMVQRFGDSKLESLPLGRSLSALKQSRPPSVTKEDLKPQRFATQRSSIPSRYRPLTPVAKVKPRYSESVNGNATKHDVRPKIFARYQSLIPPPPRPVTAIAKVELIKTVPPQPLSTVLILPKQRQSAACGCIQDLVNQKSRLQQALDAVELANKSNPVVKEKKDDLERIALMKRNEELKELALGLDRLLVVRKMKLKFYHDWAAIEELKGQFNNEEPKDNNELVLNMWNVRNENLRLRIRHEQKRIEELRKSGGEEERAAVIIQSAVRGFLVRRELNCTPRMRRRLLNSSLRARDPAKSQNLSVFLDFRWVHFSKVPNS